MFFLLSWAAVFINILPLVGMLLAVLCLGEHLGWREIVGGLWITTGVYLTTHPQMSWWQKETKSCS